MKSVLILTTTFAIGALAQDFTTGQAARMVIGQRTFTDQRPGASDELVGGVSGVAYAANTLFVADANRVGAIPQNHRVLIYKNLSGTLPQPTDELFFDRPCPVCTGRADVVLGQPDFAKTEFKLKQDGLRTPTAVASDGRILAVADTDNNRILIWNSIPSVNGQPADVVLGQPNFTSAAIPPGNVPNNKSMRGPQGVWIQNGKLYVADTQNHRVLIYNSIPTSNGAAADVVLGQPDFNTFVEPDLTQQKVDAKATNMLNPVSVTSDGVHLFVTDLGHNRVLVWNSIPTRNQTPADLALGQPDVTSAIPNNSEKLCEATGKDADGKDTFPKRCLATLDFPRFALSDGRRLFIADGGNDRVLIYGTIPAQSGAPANYVIGQLGGGINQASDSTDSMRTPMSMAWDGTNLYVTDSFNRRVMVYSVAMPKIPYSGVRNAASREIFAVGGITFAGTIKENDEITIKIGGDGGKEYKYKLVKDDTFGKVIAALIKAINAGDGDPKVLAIANPVLNGIVLTSRAGGSDGNAVEYAVTTSDGATITVTTSGATLSGGQDAAKIAPGALVTILGDDLAPRTESAPEDRKTLPTTLADTQVYFDGIRAPLLMVSPTMINAQIPFEVRDRTSVNAYVRAQFPDGVRVTTPIAVTIVLENPGIFADPGPDPRPAVAYHGSPYAIGTVSVDGSVKAGDAGTITIEDREYSYTVKAEDTLATIRDAFVDLINASADEKVTASAATSFTRIRLRAKVAGPDGNGIKIGAKSPDGAQLVLTAFNVELCCANQGRITEENPAIPGETIIVYATGLGLPEPRVETTGERYEGPSTEPQEFVSSLAGGKTANVIGASLAQGGVGLYEVILELNSDIPTNPFTQLTIAQNIYVSNIVTFPVVNPKDTGTPP
ncbi:MAG: hypothetical protein HYR60_04595 [Acidobacteria bacterium]|nr:hypothetical protein [Acidobacteriota bacterium]